MAGVISDAPEMDYLPKANRNCLDVVNVAVVLQGGKQEIAVPTDGQTAGGGIKSLAIRSFELLSCLSPGLVLSRCRRGKPEIQNCGTQLPDSHEPG